MLNIELTTYGLESTIGDIIDYLADALNSKSKKNKDLNIGRALGMAEALQYMIEVTAEKSETDTKE